MNNFYLLMEKVKEVVFHQWNIWGFHFSFFGVWFYMALCKLCFWFIWQVFGQMPSFSNDYNDGYSMDLERREREAGEYWDWVHRRRDSRKHPGD